jgi:hypothetical protein
MEMTVTLHVAGWRSPSGKYFALPAWIHFNQAMAEQCEYLNQLENARDQYLKQLEARFVDNDFNLYVEFPDQAASLAWQLAWA